MTALATANVIREAMIQARQVFAEREEAIHALSVALCSGEHMIMLGRPGVAKSAIVHWMAKTLGLDYFWTLLNPDTLREDLMGPISLKSLQEDRWERNWANLAVSDIAFTDEVGKASGQVLNLLLNVMEERRFDGYDLPLHCLIGASNETLDGEVEALWDRFAIRLVLNPVQDLENFRAMLRSDVRPVQHYQISRSNLADLRATAELMAQTAPDPVIDMLVEMKSLYTTRFDAYISDRRWRRVLKVAAGNALLHGRSEIEIQDLHVARWMLWANLDKRLAHMREVYSFVSSFVEKELGDLMECQALAEELLGMAANERIRLAEAADLLMKAKTLARRVKKNLSNTGYKEQWTEILRKTEQIESMVLDDESDQEA